MKSVTDWGKIGKVFLVLAIANLVLTFIGVILNLFTNYVVPVDIVNVLFIVGIAFLIIGISLIRYSKKIIVTKKNGVKGVATIINIELIQHSRNQFVSFFKITYRYQYKENRNRIGEGEVAADYGKGLRVDDQIPIYFTKDNSTIDYDNLLEYVDPVLANEPKMESFEELHCPICGRSYTNKDICPICNTKLEKL